MLSYKDYQYQRTKLIKRGEILMEPAVKELSEWVSKTKNVKVVNVILDVVAPNERPRINIVLEFFLDRLKFWNELEFGCDTVECGLVIRKFNEIVKGKKINNLNLDGLFVIFSDFDSIAKQEAFYKIPKIEFEQLKSREPLKNYLF